MANEQNPLFKNAIPGFTPQAYGYNPYQIGKSFGGTMKELAFLSYKRKMEEAAAERARQAQINQAAATQLMGRGTVGIPGKPTPTLQDIMNVSRGTQPVEYKIVDNKKYALLTNRDTGEIKWELVPEQGGYVAQATYSPSTAENAKKRYVASQSKELQSLKDTAWDNVMNTYPDWDKPDLRNPIDNMAHTALVEKEYKRLAGELPRDTKEVDVNLQQGRTRATQFGTELTAFKQKIETLRAGKPFWSPTKEQRSMLDDVMNQFSTEYPEYSDYVKSSIKY